MEPRISIIVITLGRRTLYKLVKKLSKQKTHYDFEILLISSAELNIDKLGNDKIRIVYSPLGRGYSFYRNLGVKNTKNQVLVFIDDDEEPFNSDWLTNLTDPILKGDVEVVTSGYDVSLGNGYLADSISHLGFPGGGCLGFKTMWNVNDQQYTNHLCTGNFAVSREVLEKIGLFNEDLMYGYEDDALSRKLREQSIRIKYVEKATVSHMPRTNLTDFIRWQIRRGKSMYDFKLSDKSNNIFTKSRLSYPKKILKKSYLTKYFLMVILLILLQFFCRMIGYSIRVIESNLKE